ncbi:MAG: amino acid ABC transporter ATP-binding protein [Clostridiaceae bacterium]|nr:amino acid ABC transporter ATP-binding protein [Clostridiaceae bacterium]
MYILEVNNLHKNFDKTKVLKGVSFKMKQGEVLSVLGASGSGKTTLLRCITSLESADVGQILVDGSVIFDAQRQSQQSKKQIRQNQLHLGLVFQSFNLFPQYNVLDNVVLAPKLLAKERTDYKDKKKEILNEITDNAKAILDRIGLTDKLYNYPCELSGGQQQRVSIARALALNPKVLFFDEPTSALDPELTGEILKVIRSLAAKRITMVIVTHEIEFARNVSDRVIFMSDGVIIEEGKPQDVIDNPKNERTQLFLKKLSDK